MNASPEECGKALTAATTTPEGFVVGTCRVGTCQAPIVWARIVDGLIPVDAEPSPAGDIRLFEVQGNVHARFVSAEDAVRMRRDPAAVPLRTSHFATCRRAPGWAPPRRA